MNVIRKVVDRKRNIHLLEGTIRSIFHETIKNYTRGIETTEEAEIFFENFKANIRTLRIFNYSFYSVQMYKNGISTIVKVNMKDEDTSKIYAISFDLGWW